jgi:hypothetical protein
MSQRYPHQDLSASAEGYLWDYQQLVLRYSLSEVHSALAEWRLTPGAKFFPRPDEIAESIEASRQRDHATRQAQRHAELRRKQIEEFWPWAEQWMKDTGNDEAELLRRFPSYRGTKPGGSEAARPNIVPMPPRSSREEFLEHYARAREDRNGFKHLDHGR